MRGGLSPLEKDVLLEQEVQDHKGEVKIAFSTKVQMAIAQVIEALTGRYNNDGCIDVSMWQATDSTKVDTSVRFDLMHHPKFHGAYFKMGEIWGNAVAPYTDAFMDPLEKIHREALIKEGMLALGYIYYDPAWAINRGWTFDDVPRLLDGTTQEVAKKLIMNDVHLSLLARKTKKGAGRVTDPQVLLDLEDWDGDGWVWDFEKGWTSAGARVNDIHMSTALRTTTVGAKLLSDWGYLPKGQGDTQVVYSSEWFLQTYGGPLTRDAVGLWDTIAAGYYLNDKDGYIYFDTLDKFYTWLGTIPNKWQPYNIGAVQPGKVVLAYQILANLTLPMAVNRFGKFTALDWNSFNISKDALLARYPKYKARLAAWTPDQPPPVPDPNPIYVRGKTRGGVRIRLTPKVTTLLEKNNEIGLLPGLTELDLTETRLVGEDLWVRVNRNMWMCAKYKGSILIDLFTADNPPQ